MGRVKQEIERGKNKTYQSLGRLQTIGKPLHPQTKRRRRRILPIGSRRHRTQLRTAHPLTNQHPPITHGGNAQQTRQPIIAKQQSFKLTATGKTVTPVKTSAGKGKSRNHYAQTGTVQKQLRHAAGTTKKQLRKQNQDNINEMQRTAKLPQQRTQKVLHPGRPTQTGIMRTARGHR
jgi:hypothetical protein